MILVNLLDTEDLKKIKETFQAIDIDHSGLISIQELKKAFSNLGIDKMNEEQIEQIVRRVDYDQNGEINYSEFLTGTINEVHLSEENLHQLFNHLDVFNDGFITKYSLLKTFHRSSKDISEAEVEEMLKEMGMDPEVQITFDNF